MEPKPTSSDDLRAAARYEEAVNQLEAFWNENPGLYEHLEKLLHDHREAANHLEACARRRGETLGAARLFKTVSRVSPEALAAWVEEHGVNSLEQIGGEVRQTYSITVGKLREAAVKGLLSQEEAASLTVPTPQFSLPEAGALPPRKA